MKEKFPKFIIAKIYRPLVNIWLLNKLRMLWDSEAATKGSLWRKRHTARDQCKSTQHKQNKEPFINTEKNT